MYIYNINFFKVSCSFDGTIKVWDYSFDPETGKAGKVLKQFDHADDIRCISYARWGDKRVIMAGTEQCNVLAFPIADEDFKHIAM